jgi:RHS repeat-associated protein
MVKRDSTVLIGNYYEYTNGSAKKFYYAGGVRIAVRPASDGVARWILSDHLGSTAKTVSSGGSTEGEQRYMPFGLDRYTTGSLNTAYRYTGQRIEDNVDLYFYQSRWYDPVVGRFIQPDSIVPEPGNPQALNRYSYVLNNPLRYVDPSGFDPLDAEWEQNFYNEHGYRPTDDDRRDWLFSLLFPGSGPNGTWTAGDWELYGSGWTEYPDPDTGELIRYNRFFKQHREASGKEWVWPNARPAGLHRFLKHLQHFASLYEPWEQEKFVRAFGMLWAGIPYDMPWPAASIEVTQGGQWADSLYEGNEGWISWMSEPGRDDPVHHYAGLFYLGYFAGTPAATVVNIGREVNQWPPIWPDVHLGNVAAIHASVVRSNPFGHYMLGYFIAANVCGYPLF